MKPAPDASRDGLDHYLGTDENEVAEPLHGFLPLAKDATTVSLRNDMKQLEQRLYTLDSPLTADELADFQNLVRREKTLIDSEVTKAADP